MCEGEATISDDDHECDRHCRVYVTGYAKFGELFSLPSRLARRLHGCMRLMVKPLVIIDPKTSGMEAVFLSRARIPMEEWQRTLEMEGCTGLTCIGLPLPGDPAAVGCARRMIERGVRCWGPQMPEHFYEAYRILSGGLMHPQDMRIIVMGPRAVGRLRKLREALLGKILEASQRRQLAMRAMIQGGEAEEGFFMDASHALDALQREKSDLDAVMRRQRMLRTLVHGEGDACELCGGAE